MITPVQTYPGFSLAKGKIVVKNMPWMHGPKSIFILVFGPYTPVIHVHFISNPSGVNTSKVWPLSPESSTDTFWLI